MKRVSLTGTACAIAATMLVSTGASAQCGVSTDCPYRAFLPATGAGAGPAPARCTDVIRNGGFEAEPTSGDPSRSHPGWWQSTMADQLPISQERPFEGLWGVWFGGHDNAQDLIGTSYNIPTLPADTGQVGDLVSAEISYVVSMVSEENTLDELDFLDLVLVDVSDETAERAVFVDTFSNADTRGEWVRRVGAVTDALIAREGWTAVELIFLATTDDSRPTSWFVDNVALTLCVRVEAIEVRSQ